MADGTRDRAPHLGHALEERQRPARREHVERERVVAGVQQLEQRLREDRVADPGRTDDQDACMVRLTDAEGVVLASPPLALARYARLAPP